MRRGRSCNDLLQQRDSISCSSNGQHRHRDGYRLADEGATAGIRRGGGGGGLTEAEEMHLCRLLRSISTSTSAISRRAPKSRQPPLLLSRQGATLHHSGTNNVSSANSANRANRANRSIREFRSRGDEQGLGGGEFSSRGNNKNSNNDRCYVGIDVGDDDGHDYARGDDSRLKLYQSNLGIGEMASASHGPAEVGDSGSSSNGEGNGHGRTRGGEVEKKEDELFARDDGLGLGASGLDPLASDGRGEVNATTLVSSCRHKKSVWGLAEVDRNVALGEGTAVSSVFHRGEGGDDGDDGDGGSGGTKYGRCEVVGSRARVGWARTEPARGCNDGGDEDDDLDDIADGGFHRGCWRRKYASGEMR